MTDATRKNLLQRLGELMQICPEMRFGQLIANMVIVARGTDVEGIWEMEDDELLSAVDWQLSELRARRGTNCATPLTDSQTVSAAQLLAFAGQLEDEEWNTLVRNQPFQYRVTAEGLEIIPESRKTRHLSRNDVDKFCDEFNRKKSFSPSDYPENWHKSYLLALIKRLLQGKVAQVES